MAWNSYVGAFGSSSGAQISCSGACSSSSRARISSSGQKLQSLEAPKALSFSRGLAFSPSGATTLPHIDYVCEKTRLDLVVPLAWVHWSESYQTKYARQTFCLFSFVVFYQFIVFPLLQLTQFAWQEVHQRMRWYMVHDGGEEGVRWYVQVSDRLNLFFFNYHQYFDHVGLFGHRVSFQSKEERS